MKWSCWHLGSYLQRGGFLAHHKHAALVLALIDRHAAVHPVHLFVGWAHVPIDIGTVHVNLTAELRSVALLHQRLTDFVAQDEGCLVLHVQTAPHLQCRNPLDGIGVDGNRSQVHLERQFVKGKDGAGRDAERVLAVLAALLFAGGDEIVLVDRSARRARHCLAIAPTHFLENLEGLNVVHLEDTAYRQGTGLG